MSGQESPPDRIELRGLRALGTHGVLPEEHERAQPFEVDLDLEVDLRTAAQSDLLGDTVDYGAVTAAVAAAIGGAHAELLEHLAERIATAALDSGAPHAAAVTVSVRKTRPPVPCELASAGVTIHRRRHHRPAAGTGEAAGAAAAAAAAAPAGATGAAATAAAAAPAGATGAGGAG